METQPGSERSPQAGCSNAAGPTHIREGTRGPRFGFWFPQQANLSPQGETPREKTAQGPPTEGSCPMTELRAGVRFLV